MARFLITGAIVVIVEHLRLARQMMAFPKGHPLRPKMKITFKERP